jgi:predicted metal-dependent hydrolase
VSDPGPTLLREGVRLFNGGEYFAAHEVLEQAWLAEQGPVRDLYKGLLQVGVGLHHARRGNRRGALRLLDRGIAALEPFAPAHLGLDVAALVADASRTRAALARPRGLETFDWAEAPRARFASTG